MKKRLTWILLPVFAIAMLFGLASCSNAYSGNYKEVTAEDLNAVQEKLANVETEAPAATVYELTSSAKVAISVAGSTGNAEVKMNALSDDTNNRHYAKTYYNASSSGSAMSGSFVATIETWQDGSTMYVSVDAKGTGLYSEFTLNKKLKGSTSEVEKAISGISSLTTSFLSSVNTNISLDDFLEGLESVSHMDGVKLYQDGNKYKLEMAQGEMKVSFYLLINADKTYQVKYEIPQVSSQGMTVSADAELKPTTKAIAMPNDSEFTPAN